MGRKFLASVLSILLVLPLTTAASNTDHLLPQDQGKVERESKSEWSLVWSDEFEGPEIDRTKWTYDIGNWMLDQDGNQIAPGWGNNEKEYYTDSPENSYIEDGKLVIKAKEEQVSDQYGSYNYTSAKLKTKGLFSKKYGRFEVKAKLPIGKGFWPAIWMLPEDDVYGTWAASGEIDIVEGWGSKPHTVAGTLHYGESWPNNKHTGKEYHFPENRDVTKWHTYALEWEPGEIRWYIDGKLYQTQNNWYSKGVDNATKFSYPAPFDQNFYLIMNLAVGGNFDGDPDATTIFPQTMQVDYVRVYDLKKREYQQAVEPIIEKVELPSDAKQPLVDGNLIYDNQYQNGFTDVPSNEFDPLYWNFVHLPDFGGNGTITTDSIEDNSYAKIEITNQGNQLYSLQLIQNLSIAKGGKYKVSFDAKSTTNRNMMVKVSAGESRGWKTYSNEETIKLTNEMQPYEFTFDMLEETDIAARLEFNAGLNGTEPVWIGNVRVEDVTGQLEDEDKVKQPLPDGNHVYNGTFDQGRMDRMTYWQLNTAEDVDATASVDEATRELKVSITNGGTQSSDVQLVQTGISSIKGNEYKLTFNARAINPRIIHVDFRSKDGTVSYSGEQTVALTTEMEEKAVTFTIPTDITEIEGQLMFNLGGNNGDVYLDDVVLLKLTETIDYSQVDLFPLENGTFDQGLDKWSNYIHNDAGANISLEQGEAKVAIENEGQETWSVILYQEHLSLSKGVEYEVSFKARSTKPRNMNVTVENGQYTRFLDQIVSLTEETQNYQFAFKMPVDEIVSLKYLMGKLVNEPIGSHAIFIDDVVLKVKNAEQIASIIKNGDFSNGTERWSDYFHDIAGANGSISIENEQLKVDVNDAGSDFWHSQLHQGDFTLEQGAIYQLSFDASSTINRTIKAIVEHNGGDYTKYMDEPVSLTSELQNFKFEFEMPTTDTQTHFVLGLGKVVDGEQLDPHTITVDNVTLLKVTDAPEVTSSPDLDNGTFDDGMEGWNVWWGDQWSGVAEGTVAVEQNELKVAITKVGNTSYSPQIYQKGIKFENGKTYTVSFDAKADQSRKVNVNIGKELTTDPWFIPFASTQTFDLTTEQQTFTYSFVMAEQTFDDGKLVFELGNILNGNVATTIYIDNVSITSN